MSLRDRLRGLRDGGGPDSGDDAQGSAGVIPAGAPSDDDLTAVAEFTEFAPRQDGDYHCIGAGLFLRFARPIVTETDGSGQPAARGEFINSGRFTVQRTFARPIVYTVLAESVHSSENAEYDAVLVLRRTDTNTRTAQRLEFAFEPDEA